MIDLHIHSNFSDGSCTPEELVDLCVAAGVSAAALTDHDTAAGVPRFLAAAEARGIRAVSGLELSVEVPGLTVHILAYGVDVDDADLSAALEKVRDGRRRRNASILARLSKLGCYVSPGEVAAQAGDGEVVGRLNIAQALVRKGYARSTEDAFNRLLGKGKPAYEERFRLEPAEAIRLVRGAGGLPVLAHPSQCGMGVKQLHDFVEGLASEGLAGIEVFYPGHSDGQREQYLELARKFGLLATGGTDFHGGMKPGREIGIGFGSLKVGDEIFDALLARLGEVRGGRVAGGA